MCLNTLEPIGLFFKLKIKKFVEVNMGGMQTVRPVNLVISMGVGHGTHFLKIEFEREFKYDLSAATQPEAPSHLIGYACKKTIWQIAYSPYFFSPLVIFNK